MCSSGVHRAYLVVGVVFSGLVFSCCGGCGSGPASAQAGWPETPAVALDPGDGAAARTADPFGNAALLDSNDAGRHVISGCIYSPGETDVYDIGAVVPGDRVEIEVESTSGDLDPTVAVFDADQKTMCVNDDRAYYDGWFDSYLNFTCRRSSARCYVVVSSSPRADTTGDYLVYVKRTTGPDPGEAERQVLYLNFDGADNVVIGQRSPVDVPAFSGALIGEEFAADTQELITRTVARMRRDFSGFNVTVLSSSDQDPPAGEHSTVHFGSYNAQLLGIADSVDGFNQSKDQQAIVFVDTFSVFLTLQPTVDEMADALANVASHEAGHLLGLNHVTDPHAIMDTTASLRQMLVPQSFSHSPLGADVFAIGYQDGPLLLLESVGGNTAVLEATKTLRRFEYRDPWYDEGPQTPARELAVFSVGPAHDPFESGGWKPDNQD